MVLDRCMLFMHIDLTARHFTEVLVGSYVLLYKRTLLNSVRLELDLGRFVQRDINVRYWFVPRLF